MTMFGFHPVTARLRQAPESVRELYVDAKRDDTRMRDLVSLAQAAGVEARRVEATRLDRMCPQRTHQGVVAFVTAQPATLGLDELLDRVLENAHRIIPHDRGIILLIDDHRQAYFARTHGLLMG
jgi:tRNA G18 (ribose-2'-O)-methylase SpoU